MAGVPWLLQPPPTHAGHRRLRRRPQSPRPRIRASKAGYSQPCSSRFTPTGDTVLDVYLVPNAVLAATGIPQSLPMREPTLVGTVFERSTDGTRQGIPGATVIADFSGGDGWAPSATTVSDQRGEYSSAA